MDDTGVGQRAQGRLHRTGDVALHRPAVDDDVAHTLQPSDMGNRRREFGADSECGEASDGLEVADLDDASGSQHRNPVAHRLDFAEDVRGEEHRLPTGLSLPDARPEDLLHEGVESGRRFVEQ